MQKQARETFTTQADHFRDLAEKASRAPYSLQNTLDELDARFCERLRRVASEKLDVAEGLLLVGGLEYSSRVEGKKYLVWSSGASMFGRGTDVLVVIDKPDDQLENLDQTYRSVRALILAEQLTVFNAKPYEERAAVIRSFMQRRESGHAGNNGFGVDDSLLQYVVIDHQSMTVLPAER